MKKINFENLPSTLTPVNAENLNIIQDNVESNINEINDNLIKEIEKNKNNLNNKIDQYNNYTEDEIVVGTWIGKPLYRKVIQFTTTLSANVVTTIDSGISDIDNVIKINGVIFNTTGTFNAGTRMLYNLPFNSAPGELSTYIGLRMKGTNIEVVSTTGFNENWKKVLILEYTKTSD